MGEILLTVDDVDTNSSVGKMVQDIKTESASAAGTSAGDDKAAADKAAADKAASDKIASDKAVADKAAADAAGGQSVVKPEEIESAFIEQITGKKISKDEFKQLFENLPTIAKDYEELKGKLAASPKFANDYIKGLNDYVDKGGDPETYNKIQALDLEKLNGLEAIKAKMKWDFPQLTDAQIDRKLAKQYHQTEDALEDDKADGLIDISIDAKKAKDELLKIKQDKSIPDPERLRIQEEEVETQRIAAWTPVTQTIVKDFNSFDIPIAVDKDGKVTESLKFTDIPADLKKVLQEDMRLIIEESAIPFSQANTAEIKKVLQERFIVMAYPKLLAAAFTEAETRAKKAAMDEYRNGNLPKTGDVKEGALKKGTNEDELFDKQMSRL